MSEVECSRVGGDECNLNLLWEKEEGECDCECMTRWTLIGQRVKVCSLLLLASLFFLINSFSISFNSFFFFFWFDLLITWLGLAGWLLLFYNLFRPLCLCFVHVLCIIRSCCSCYLPLDFPHAILPIYSHAEFKI